MQKRKIKGKKNYRFIIAGLIILTIILISLSIFLPRYLILDKKEIKAKIIVYDKVGIDVDNETLSFGGVMPGGSSLRKIMISSNYNKDMILEVIPIGDMNKFVKKEKYTIKKGQGYELWISASVPEDMPMGEYEGSIRFILYRKLF